jgi:hypothetical protein
MNNKLRELLEAARRMIPKNSDTCAWHETANAALEAEPDDWQPIETAPQDGRDILVCYSWGTIEMLSWEGEGLWCHSCRPPTHWMPLPAPPEVKP